MTLDDEKLKADYEHRLQLLRILVEKGLLGLLLGLAVLAANMLVEDFKSDLARQKFLLENRLTALQTLRESYSTLSNHLWRLVEERNPISTKRLLKPYGADFDKFIHLANRSSLLFSAAFRKAIDQHIWIHTATSEGQSEVSREHTDFLSEVFEDFDHVTRAALSEDTPEVRTPAQGRRFELEVWSFSQVNEKGAKAYFEVNFQKWRRLKAATK